MTVVVAHIHHVYRSPHDRLDDVFIATKSLEEGRLDVFIENAELSPKAVENAYKYSLLNNLPLTSAYDHLRYTVEEFYRRRNAKPPKISLIPPSNTRMDEILKEHAEKINYELKNRGIDDVKVFVLKTRTSIPAHVYRIGIKKNAIPNRELIKYTFSAHTAMMYVGFKEVEDNLLNFIEKNPNTIIVCGYNHLLNVSNTERYNISTTKLDPSGKILLKAYREGLNPTEVFSMCLEDGSFEVENKTLIVLLLYADRIKGNLEEIFKSNMQVSFIMEGMYSYGDIDDVVKDVRENKDIRSADKILKRECGTSFLAEWKKQNIKKAKRIFDAYISLV